ncbi:SGNH/GDSL hydrolase family protein [uncultured Nocardioides sp.]|uniref:SGNH/GDSL hydrolase family protein n=1 Tax=uncultured Nocardioides sp. TaxID=198441 RepID=UPI00260A55A3|nr:SGNH/GDSL hydrolase family protein [uncultured Nocardioides sp.]
MRLPFPGRPAAVVLRALLLALLVAGPASVGSAAPAAADPDRPRVLPLEREGQPDDTDGDAQRCAPLDPARRPLRVMFVGDSMTQGLSGSATYRYWVWRGLQEAGVDAEFVGPRLRTHRAPRDVPPRASYEHLDHGFDRQLAHAALAGSTFLTHPDPPRVLARRYDPDVVVLQLGYNDANHADGTEIARRTAAFVRSFRHVDETRGERPTRFVLGQIPLAGRSGSRPLAERNGVTREANRLVGEELAEPCLTVPNDLRTGSAPRWRPVRDTFDGRHPNTAGETIIAQRMLDALRLLGVLRGRPDVYRPDEPWTPGLELTGEAVDGGDQRLDWAESERLAGADRARLRITPPGRAPRLTAWTAGTSVILPLRPGTEVSLVLRRGGAPGRMVTAPGPAYVVPPAEG